MLFVTCPPSCEPLLAQELRELGCTDLREDFCGVLLPFSFEAVYRINYASRIATRVLLALHAGFCQDRNDLYNLIQDLDWQSYIPAKATFAIDVSGQHPAFSNTLFAAQVAKDAICDQLREERGFRPSIDREFPDVQLNLFLDRKEIVVSFDTSRQPLFKRGYRIKSGVAPLQESMAAALLRLARYTGREQLFDPCCGSATLLIEAALIATKTPPGFLRKEWGFFSLPGFSSTDWQRIKRSCDAAITSLPEGASIQGVDSDPLLIEAALVNIKQAGVAKQVKVSLSTFQNFASDPLPNFVITNPPHGIRLAENLFETYKALGSFFKHKVAKPARGFVFTAGLEQAKAIGLKPKQRHVLQSSGLDARLLEFDLY